MKSNITILLALFSCHAILHSSQASKSTVDPRATFRRTQSVSPTALARTQPSLPGSSLSSSVVRQKRAATTTFEPRSETPPFKVTSPRSAIDKSFPTQNHDQTDKTVILTKLASLRDSITTLRSDMTTLETSMANKSDTDMHFKNLDGTTATHAKTLTSNAQELAVIRNQLQMISAKINAINTTSLEERIETLETKLKAIGNNPSPNSRKDKSPNTANRLTPRLAIPTRRLSTASNHEAIATKDTQSQESHDLRKENKRLKAILTTLSLSIFAGTTYYGATKTEIGKATTQRCSLALVQSYKIAKIVGITGYQGIKSLLAKETISIPTELLSMTPAVQPTPQ